MKTRFARLGIILSCFGLVFGVATMAAQAYEPQNNWTCASSGSGACIAHNTSNITAVAHGSVGSDDKLSTLQQTGMCNNGMVSSGCPFDSSSAYNGLFYGDDIVCLKYTNFSSGYVGVQNSPALGNENLYFRSDCGGTNGFGTFWVVHNSSFINVKDSDVFYEIFGTEQAQYMTSNGSGNIADVGTFASGPSNWASCDSGC